MALINTLYESFSPQSGQLIGFFKIDKPLPWDIELGKEVVKEMIIVVFVYVCVCSRIELFTLFTYLINDIIVGR